METNDLERTKEKQAIRVKELKSVYQLITTGSDKLFDFIDKENVYMAGHAVGANSAILAAHELGDKVRAVASFDGIVVVHPASECSVPLLSMDTESVVVKDKDMELERDKMHSLFTNSLNVRYLSGAHSHLCFKDTPL